METLSIVFMLVAFVLLVIPAVSINNKAVFPLIIIPALMLFFSRELAIDASKGKPASLSNLILTTGEKYEVVAMYEKYIVVKSFTDEDEKGLRFIGPLVNSGTLSVGEVFIKTAEDSLGEVSATLK